MSFHQAGDFIYSQRFILPRGFDKFPQKIFREGIIIEAGHLESLFNSGEDIIDLLDVQAFSLR